MPIRLYETMYIVRPEVTDEELQALMGRVADAIGQMGGTIGRHDVWERRELAYEIDGCRRGTYVICYFNADSGSIDALRKEMELEEQVLRHIIVVSDPRAIWRPLSGDAEAEAAVEPEEPAPEALEDAEAEAAEGAPEMAEAQTQPAEDAEV